MLTLFSLVFLIWCFSSTREATYAISFIPISFPTLKEDVQKKINMLFTGLGRSVREKTVPLVLSTALGLQPRAVLKTSGTVLKMAAEKIQHKNCSTEENNKHVICRRPRSVRIGISRSQSPRAFWSAPRHGALE